MSQTERFPPSTSLLHRRSISVLFYHFAGIPSSLNKPFVVGPGYSPIPGKLVTKIRSGQFVDIADRLGENLKALEAELQTYLDGNFWRVHQKNEYKRSPTLSHGWRHSRSTCGIYILNTSRQFPGKALASLRHCLSEGRNYIRPGRLVSYKPRPVQFPYSFGATVPAISRIFSIP